MSMKTVLRAATFLAFAVMSIGASVAQQDGAPDSRPHSPKAYAIPRASTNPLLIGTPQIGSGAGTPPISGVCPNTAPEGSLCLPTNAPQTYHQLLPTNTVPARIQEASAASTYQVSLGASPTVGNYLIGFCWRYQSLAAANTGWTQASSYNATGANDPYIIWVYHRVVGGDTATQTPCTGGASGNEMGSTVTEVSGLSSVWSASYQSTTTSSANSSGGPSASVSTTSTSANSLAILAAGYTGSGSVAITLSAAYTNQTTALNGLSGGRSGSQLFPSNSSTVSGTGSIPGYFGQPEGITVSVLIVNASTGAGAGYIPFSDLTTLKNNGSSITTDPLSLNFSTGLTASDDGGGNSTVALSGAGLRPMGRLTLATGTPVLTSNQSGKSTIYYDCFGGTLVPYYDGTTDQVDAISSCEVSTTMQTTGTGVVNNSDVFDIWWVHSGTNRICVATNGSGGGWASDTGGSTTARGTGYSQVHNTRGYWTNVNAITHCYNGTSDYGAIAADKATYLGSAATTAAGQTSMVFAPAAAAGGAAPMLGLWNAYNRVLTSTSTSDSTASWTLNSATIGAMDAGATGSGLNNRASYVDGLGQSAITTSNARVGGQGAGDIYVGTARDSATAFDCSGQATLASSTVATVTVPCRATPSVGLHYVQELEASSVSQTFYGAGTSPTRMLNILTVELEM